MLRRWFTALIALEFLVIAGCAESKQTGTLGQSVSMRNGELTVTRSEVSSANGQLEVAVYFRWTGSAGDLLSGWWGPKLKMRLSDSGGKQYEPVRPKWSPILPVPEEMYAVMRNVESYYQSKGRDKAYEADVAASADRFRQLETELKSGHNPVNWVHIFRVPSDSSGYTVIAGGVEVSLGR